MLDLWRNWQKSCIEVVAAQITFFRYFAEQFTVLYRDKKEENLVDRVVDDQGIVIPLEELKNQTNTIHRSFRFKKTEVDWDKLVTRLGSAYQISPVSPENMISPEEFELRFQNLRIKVRKLGFEGLERGVFLPFYIPRKIFKDEGCLMDAFMEVFRSVYEKCTPFLKIDSHLGKVFKGRVFVREDRYKKFLDILRRRDIVGIIYLNGLKTYSTSAQIKMISYLPKEFMFSGFDILATLLGFPKIIYGSLEVPTPSITMSSISVIHEGYNIVPSLRIRWNDNIFREPSPHDGIVIGSASNSPAVGFTAPLCVID